ncbi:MAG: hypothetical protein Q9225_001857 [Loekoesia sp. 1 TL-2023]
MLNGKVYVVTDPELVNSVNRSSRVLAFNPFIAQLGKRITGHDEATSRIIQHNLNGENGPGYVTEIHDGTVAALMDPKSVQSISYTMLREFSSYLSRLKQKNEIGLFAWIRQVMTRCNTTAIYGQANPLNGDSKKLDQIFWDFDENLNLLMLNIFPSILTPKGNSARAKLGSGFQEYFNQYVPGQTKSSLMTLTRHLINNKYNLDIWNAARLEVGVLLGVLANIIPTTFWLITHIYSDTTLLQQIRQEIESTSVDHRDNGAAPTLKVLTMRERCTLLHATLREVLRHHALGSSVRFVREDIYLDGKYLLRKDGIVQMPMSVLHADRAVWGDDIGVFRPSRFLKPSENHDSSGDLKQTPSAFRPFGGGTSMCPGRHLVTMGTMAVAAYMILQFDLEPVDGAWALPRPKQESLATNVFPPERDIQVRIVRRKGCEGVGWCFSMD